MIICGSPQGSPEWFQDRAGAITGSMFATIMDKYKTGKQKGQFKAAALDYAFRLAIERNSGRALQDENFQTYAMWRGHQLESVARRAHEIQCFIDVEPCGFIKTDDGKFGVSADGLIGQDGGSEYKCFVDPAKLRAILIDKDIGDVIWQVQGGMWLTGRKWWHFGLYCPDIDPSLELVPFERDEVIIEELEQELVAFDRLVEDYRQVLINRLSA